ncbi:MAG: hypothetical protein L6W00_21480 [Lentisphaeria bacterium]|nr:MAG: hypothetical protein L6W00_21480 [Lentisphaeria bacterium]
MKETVKAAARNFLENETEFHLGFLPTEQSNPITRNLDRAFSAGTAEGVRLLQRADREVLPMARKIFASAEFRRMVDAGEKRSREAAGSSSPAAARPAGSRSCSNRCGGSFSPPVPATPGRTPSPAS